MSSKVELVAWLGDVNLTKRRSFGGGGRNFATATQKSEICQRKVRVRTPSDHKNGVFSLGENRRKAANIGTDSLNYVDFVGKVEA